MSDLPFWLVFAIAAGALGWLWVTSARLTDARTDLGLAGDELRAAHATIDRLTREAQGRPTRGARGRFTSTRAGRPGG